MDYDKPTPDVRVARLPSAGRPRVTLHHYLETITGIDYEGAYCWFFVFRCLETGSTRTWGYQLKRRPYRATGAQQ